MTSHRYPRRAALGALALLGLTAGAVTVVTVLGGPALAADDSSASAYALAGSGTDATGQLAAATSSGTAQSATVGSYRAPSGTFTAAGLSATATAGSATASVADLVVGGTDLGSFSATCSQGVVSTQMSHTETDPARKIHVTPGGDGNDEGVAATVTISGLGAPAETITVAHVACAQLTTPSPSLSVPASPPSSSAGTATSSGPPSRTSPVPTHAPGISGEPVVAPAPAPTPLPGQARVTG